MQQRGCSARTFERVVLLFPVASLALRLPWRVSCQQHVRAPLRLGRNASTHPPQLTTHHNRSLSTALQHAAMDGGHLEAIEALLRGGAPADQTFPGGATPLYLAALTGRTKMIDLLIRNGAAVDEGLTIDAHPTTLGCWGELPRMLYERGLYKYHGGILQPVTALLVASAGDHADAVKSLLKAGAALDGTPTKDEDDTKDDNDEEGGGGGDEWSSRLAPNSITRSLSGAGAAGGGVMGDPGRGKDGGRDDFWVEADLESVNEGGWRRVPERGGEEGKAMGEARRRHRHDRAHPMRRHEMKMLRRRHRRDMGRMGGLSSDDDMDMYDEEDLDDEILEMMMMDRRSMDPQSRSMSRSMMDMMRRPRRVPGAGGGDGGAAGGGAGAAEWACAACTFVNNAVLQKCAVCTHARPQQITGGGGGAAGGNGGDLPGKTSVTPHGRLLRSRRVLPAPPPQYHQLAPSVLPRPSPRGVGCTTTHQGFGMTAFWNKHAKRRGRSPRSSLPPTKVRASRSVSFSPPMLAYLAQHASCARLIFRPTTRTTDVIYLRQRPFSTWPFS